MCKVIPIGGMTCPDCDGVGEIPYPTGPENPFDLIDCPTCDGKGWVLEQDEETYEKP